jgi:hypothetical protein
VAYQLSNDGRLLKTDQSTDWKTLCTLVTVAGEQMSRVFTSFEIYFLSFMTWNVLYRSRNGAKRFYWAAPCFVLIRRTDCPFATPLLPSPEKFQLFFLTVQATLASDWTWTVTVFPYDFTALSGGFEDYNNFSFHGFFCCSDMCCCVGFYVNICFRNLSLPLLPTRTSNSVPLSWMLLAKFVAPN